MSQAAVASTEHRGYSACKEGSVGYVTFPTIPNASDAVSLDMWQLAPSEMLDDFRNDGDIKVVVRRPASAGRRLSPGPTFRNSRRSARTRMR